MADRHDDEKGRINGERHAGIVIRDNKILLIHRRKKGMEYYVFPGGHRRQGEKGEDTLVREILEETNTRVTNPQLAFEFRDYPTENIDYYYKCEWLSGDKPELVGEEKTRNSEDNFYEPLWVDKEKVPELNILPKFAKDWLVDNLL
jgi:8-oxo-dGTP diphosphatase